MNLSTLTCHYQTAYILLSLLCITIIIANCKIMTYKIVSFIFELFHDYYL